MARFSHELKVPLSTISLIAELLDESQESNECKGLITHLKSSVNWLKTMVEDIETWTSIVDRRLVLKLEPVSIVECVHEAIQILEPISNQKHKRILLLAPDELSPAWADKVRIKHVLINLLSNAINYSLDGDQIEVEVLERDGFVETRVRDHGPGMDSSELDKVFESFFRGSVGRESYSKGQGLGLSIVKAIVEMHGGVVGVQSSRGVGTTFWFRIPLALDKNPKSCSRLFASI
ncbi:histidine kinase [Thermobaculum terrenum ATCC BAA-798]|uniref:histidine kinase n=2 Tax=Thermobaculum TaxID=262406 RepID=D1CB84_THET1|nr:histidine kinase [Thermobaculum terrenum ATCC BAA-798]